MGAAIGCAGGQKRAGVRRLFLRIRSWDSLPVLTFGPSPSPSESGFVWGSCGDGEGRRTVLYCENLPRKFAVVVGSPACSPACERSRLESLPPPGNHAHCSRAGYGRLYCGYARIDEATGTASLILRSACHACPRFPVIL